MIMWPEKKRTNAWQCPEHHSTRHLDGGRKHAIAIAMEDLKHLPNLIHSNSSSLTINKWFSEYNPLKEPGPLGLKLEKSPTFLELIQKTLNQAYYKNGGYLAIESLQVGKKKDIMARAWSSDPLDKLKASNFPALRLKIGDWEYVSQRECDLVAKCYFAKHKLVYEILDDGLIKNKIEIQWEDILGLKANIPENGPATLTVRLRKEPLFFRESNPQPRKHTTWQATSDFTGGKVSRARQHHLQCAQGVINKHYEKLIHCDTRLNFLSQQYDPLLDMPFQEDFVKAPNVSHNIVSYRPELSKLPSVDINNGMVLQSTSQCLLKDADFAHKVIWKNNNINCWQDVNYYSNPEGMIQSSTSQCIMNDANYAQKDTREDHVINVWQDGKDYSNLASNIPSNDYWMNQGWGEEFGIVSGYKQDLGMSRKDSFTDLMSQLPPIATLYDVFEDDKILYP